LFVVLISLAAIPVLFAAPVPTHLMPKDPPLTFPTRVGTKWVYETGSGDMTVVISEVKEEKDGARLVTAEQISADGTRTLYMVWHVSTGGVLLVAERGRHYAEPWCIFKLPHREGQTWGTRSRYVGDKADLVGEMTSGPTEKVRVPAGEFSTMRVEWAINGRKLAPYWYAHGVGLVQLGQHMKLKSFTPGKD
jgi:hypothetical protein